MRLYLPLLFVAISVFCYSQENDTLYIFYDEQTEFPGYMNAAGDTVIEAGVFEIAISEVFVDFFLVIDPIGKAYAINRDLDTLYEVYWFDNGPDYIEEGMFRIVEDGMIGYANEKGEIVIPPKYKCARVFQDGWAEVAYDCERIPEGEFYIERSNQWFRIDPNGNEIRMPQD